MTFVNTGSVGPDRSGADPGFLKGGGVQARIQDFSQAPPPPWTLSAWRHPPSENLKNTPTLGHSQAPPPPWTLPVWRHPHSKGGAGWLPLSHTHTLDPPLGSILGLQAKKKGGANFGPNVKKPTSWPKRGGRTPPPPPWIRHWPLHDLWAQIHRSTCIRASETCHHFPSQIFSPRAHVSESSLPRS